MGRIEGKVAIVTGAASGIGRAVAALLAAEGGKVVITDVNVTDGKSSEREIGHSSAFMSHDVGNETDWKRIISDTESRFGRLDILVNNAGIGSPNVAPENVDMDEFRKVQRVNLEGTLLGCKYAMPVMRAGGGGSIINISSVAAFVPTANDLPYGTSKAGVRQLTLSLAYHCAQTGSGIRVNSIHPGAIKTPGVTRRRSAEVLERVASAIPMGHMGEPEDIAYAALYLASDESKYITGQALIVDGGYTLAPLPPKAPEA
jgi:NAD(P)-dependent dehydrogenase (short-subunit alcohol dehydrogenase family)